MRHIPNSGEVNFLSAKNKTQFKIKNQLGPFICNNRNVGQQAKKCLKDFKFINSFKWKYDPLGVFSKLRVKFKLTPFVHESKPDVKKYSNLSEWMENTLQELEK